MNLFLLRHGLAVEREEFHFASDHLRPLTAKGKRPLHKITAAMRAMELRFDVIFSSPLVRVRQTAEIVAMDLKLKKRLDFVDELKPGSDARKLVQKIAELENVPVNVLLVGHEPDLGELISMFATGKNGTGFALKKAGLAKMEIKNLRAGKCATLAWLLTPAQMKLMN